MFATAARMQEALAGRVLTRTDLRVPRFATTDLSGHVVSEVAPRGKHLFVRTDRGVSVHSHLGMDGSWRLYEPGERWRGRAFEVRGVLATDDRIAVGHRLRRLEVIRTSAEPQLLSHLGPDVLGQDWDAAEATRRLTASPEREVGEALIDQTVMAGPGNVYRSEVCFLAGVDPRTAVGRAPRPRPPRRADEVPDGSQPLRSPPRDHGRPATRARPLGLRARRETVPALRNPDPLVPGAGTQRSGDPRRITFACPRCQPLLGEPTA